MNRTLNILSHPLTRTIALVLLLTIPQIIQAAPPTFNDDVDDVPIDSGLSLVLGAGLIMGVWGYMKKKSASGE